MFLGIDIGTSSIKAVLINNNGNMVADASLALTIEHPKPHYSEQDPELWWKTTIEVIHKLSKKHPLDELKGIGLSGQQHGAVLLSHKNTVLRPAILWNDTRSYKECAWIEKELPSALKITANRVYPGFTAPKLLWVKKHEPSIFQKIHKILLPKDYIRYRLTQTFATDMSDASGTSWLNVRKRTWSDEMLTVTSCTKAQMPQLFEGTEITGTVTDEIAHLLRIPRKTPVVGGGGDNACSAVSVNCIAPNDAFISLGTSGVFFIASDHAKSNPKGCVHTMCHALKNMWHHMSVHLSAASCFDYAVTLTQSSTLPELLKESEKSFNPLNQVYFLPFLLGERTPYNDPHAKGVLFGLTPEIKSPQIMQAILEGVAFNFANGQEELLKIASPPPKINVVGGGSKSLFFANILAASLNQTLLYRKNREIGAALGAARLALLGVNQLDPKDVFENPPIEQTIEPDSQLVKTYQKKRKIFCSLYQHLQENFKVADAFNIR